MELGDMLVKIVPRQRFGYIQRTQAGKRHELMRAIIITTPITHRIGRICLQGYQIIQRCSALSLYIHDSLSAQIRMPCIMMHCVQRVPCACLRTLDTGAATTSKAKAHSCCTAMNFISFIPACVNWIPWSILGRQAPAGAGGCPQVPSWPRFILGKSIGRKIYVFSWASCLVYMGRCALVMLSSDRCGIHTVDSTDGGAWKHLR